MNTGKGIGEKPRLPQMTEDDIKIIKGCALAALFLFSINLVSLQVFLKFVYLI